MAEPIEIPFGVTYIGPQSHILDGGGDPPQEGATPKIAASFRGRSNFGGCPAH